jgi:hypothetical protein
VLFASELDIPLPLLCISWTLFTFVAAMAAIGLHLRSAFDAGPISPRSKWTLTLVAVGAATVLFAGCWSAKRPEIYKQATSPDGTWSATVSRRLSNVISGETEVLLEIADRKGKVVWTNQIDSRSVWEDVESRWPKLTVDNDRVQVGDLNDAHSSFFELRKADVFVEADS